MTIESREPGSATAALEVTEALLNPNGVVHGAVLFAMADTSMGAATVSTLAPGEHCASVEVHLRFLRWVARGRVVAETQVMQRGRRIVQLESRLVDDAGNLIATATGSFAIIPAPG
jgi:acyl-CoA thioesterase